MRSRRVAVAVRVLGVRHRRVGRGIVEQARRPRRRCAPGRCRRAAACPASTPSGRSVALARDQHGLAERRRLLLDAARVGDHEVAARRAAGQRSVAERLDRAARSRAARAAGASCSRTRGLGCTGRTKRTSVRLATRATPSAMPARPPSQFSRRCAVTTTTRPSPSTSSASRGSPIGTSSAGGPVQRVDAGVAGHEDLVAGTFSRTRFSCVLRRRREVQRAMQVSAGGSAPPGTASG